VAATPFYFATDGHSSDRLVYWRPNMIGRGHGAIYLRLLAVKLLEAGAPLVAIDPDKDNHRARRAYQKAAFQGETVVESNDGQIVPMFFVPRKAQVLKVNLQT
jgi:RimJ/RimL family protein N-acetyltransferase